MYGGNMLIGLSGRIGSGKDTVADFLVKNHSFKKISFASSLKDVCSVLFNWDRTLLEGSTADSREWRNTVDIWWSNRLKIPNLTPRMMLQLIGTQIMRQNFNDEIWIANLENKLKTVDDTNVVVTDCRFINELELIKKYNGRLVQVNRGEKPEWYDLAIAAINEDYASKIKLISEYGVHESEWQWLLADFDYIIENNSTLKDLEFKIKNLVEDLLVSK